MKINFCRIVWAFWSAQSLACDAIDHFCPLLCRVVN